MISLKFSNKEEPFYDVELSKHGDIFFYNKGHHLHNLIGPAIEYSHGDIEYYIDGMRHRLDGPAVIFSNGYKAYYVNDKLHRLDGPAVIKPNGKVEYWFNGKHLTKEEFDRLTKNND